MALNEWGTDALILPNSNEDDFGHWVPPATLHADVGSGTVVISVRDSAGTGWMAIETISEDGTKVVDLQNMPAIQITATGDAQFKCVWAAHGA